MACLDALGPQNLLSAHQPAAVTKRARSIRGAEGEASPLSQRAAKRQAGERPPRTHALAKPEPKQGSPLSSSDVRGLLLGLKPEETVLDRMELMELALATYRKCEESARVLGLVRDLHEQFGASEEFVRLLASVVLVEDAPKR